MAFNLPPSINTMQISILGRKVPISMALRRDLD